MLGGWLAYVSPCWLLRAEATATRPSQVAAAPAVPGRAVVLLGRATAALQAWATLALRARVLLAETLGVGQGGARVQPTVVPRGMVGTQAAARQVVAGAAPVARALAGERLVAVERAMAALARPEARRAAQRAAALEAAAAAPPRAC